MTDINGVYSFPGLPPGSYAVTFEMDGMSTVERTAAVPLGGAVIMDQLLAVRPVNEVVVVRGARPAPVSSPAGAASFARPRQGMDGGRTFILAAGVRF